MLKPMINHCKTNPDALWFKQERVRAFPLEYQSFNLREVPATPRDAGEIGAIRLLPGYCPFCSGRHYFKIVSADSVDFSRCELPIGGRRIEAGTRFRLVDCAAYFPVNEKDAKFFISEFGGRALQAMQL